MKEMRPNEQEGAPPAVRKAVQADTLAAYTRPPAIRGTTLTENTCRRRNHEAARHRKQRENPEIPADTPLVKEVEVVVAARGSSDEDILALARTPTSSWPTPSAR